MGEFRVALGASFDVCTPQELDDKLAGLQGHIDRRFQATAERPIRRTTSGSYSGVWTNGVAVPISLGISKPGMGRIWSITRITIAANDDHSTLANATISAYVGDAATPMLGSLLIPGVTIPYFNTFNTKAVWVDDSAELFFMLNPTATVVTPQTVVVNVEVSEFFDMTVDQQYA